MTQIKQVCVLLNIDDIELCRARGLKVSEIARVAFHNHVSGTDDNQRNIEFASEELERLKKQQTEINALVNIKERTLKELQNIAIRERQQQIEAEHKRLEEQRTKKKYCVICNQTLGSNKVLLKAGEHVGYYVCGTNTSGCFPQTYEQHKEWF